MGTRTKKKILIVEDEALLAEMYAEVFEKEGFEIILAATGKEALKAALRASPSAVLLDILLPGDNGITFLEQKQKNPAIAEIPVVVFSNFDDPHMKQTSFELGAKDYLLKTNYTPQEVVSKVKHYLK